MSPDFEPVIGLEVHVQLSTASKLFCGCSATFGAAPNTQICAVCTGQPGVLPVLNRTAVDYALKMALATGCSIRRRSRFARKNYFYPDLPKGYQISQYDEPIAEGGSLEFWWNEALHRVGLTRIHLEEDAGKNLHLPQAKASMVDLNRAGVPLIEVVSEPEVRSPEEAAEYMRALRAIVRALDICDGNLEQGSLRCDANVSLRPRGSQRLGTKVEVKNLNSFRFVQKALEFEIERQGALLRRGETIVQETRLWNADRGVTESMRSKEEAHDYRYFPEPDLPPLAVDDARIEALRDALPELPLRRRRRFVEELELSEYDAAELTRERELADYFEQAVAAGAQPKRAANWMLTELLSRVADARAVTSAPVTPAALAELLGLVASGAVSGKLAKEIWPRMWMTGRSAREIAEADNLFQQSDTSAIECVVRGILEANAEKVADYRAGKTKLYGFFVGQVMQATKGKANPQLVNDLLKRALEG
ncbi:MAG: Asp-tRNA(Asn)/Glu-tRNA(Gln) amidotransferase subunit GatB [Deltaproteobacteria bacterium]|nr:Asp-tRNA(Asn)/Glu-tRNA(Gln) amidotransferase subunit GatB [Deltaproteobacteria bacterium]